MTLSLSVISYAGRTLPAPVAITFGDRGGIIGRQAGCDWVLGDPEGHVSKRHCGIELVSGQYRITDTSTNGLFLNGSPTQLGFGVSAILRDGDRLSIGSYEVVVQLSTPIVLADGNAPLISPPPDDVPIEGSTRQPSIGGVKVPGSAGGLHSYWWNGLYGDETEPVIDRAPFPIGRADPDAAAWPGTESHSMDLVQAFLEGAGLSTELFARTEPEAVLHAAGKRLREMVSGLRMLLAARSRIRNELRVEPAEIAEQDENPLNLSIDDEQALLALLAPPRQGYMAPDVVIGCTFDELQVDEMALLAGARSAVAEALAPLAPEALMARVEGRSLLAVFRKAKFWDLFEAEFRKLRQAGEDAPLALALARAYANHGRKP